MKVLIVHGRYRSVAPSGENRVVDLESAMLAEAGHRVDRFERHSDAVAGWSLAQKAMLPVRSVRNGEVRRDLRRRLVDLRPDVAHVHNTFPLLSASVLHACHDAGVPVVATVHNYKLLCASGDFFRDGSPCHECATGAQAPALRHGCYRGSRAATLPVVAGQALNRGTWRGLVSAFIMISESQRTLMRGLGLPEDRVFVKRNFVDALPGRPGAHEHLVVHCGRLDAAKGTPLLMRAWDRHRAAYPGSSLRLLVVGGGPLEPQVREWAAGHPSVEVAGNLPPDEARLLLRRGVAAVVPSQWEETFGLVAIEAMSSGVAPIAPARGSFPELITDGVDGALFAPNDHRDLARVLADVDRDPARYNALGERAVATCAEQFSRKRNLEQLLEIYRFAIDHPQKGGAT
jgi:glycosyltransferase involved in cell wall biosynthesis